MSIKRTILALPVVSAAILCGGLAICIYLSNQLTAAIGQTESVNYPLLDRAKTSALSVGAVVDALKEAVGEGDQKRLAQVAELADKVRAQLAQLGAIRGQADTAARLGREFDDYYQPALQVARLMLGLEQGDVQQALAPMQEGQRVLTEDLARTIADAQARFKASTEDSSRGVQLLLRTTVLVAAVVILSMAAVAWWVVRSIWRQLGGEPEYACRIASAVAGGDLAMHILPARPGSLLAALGQMQEKLGGTVAGIKQSAESIRVSSSEIALGNADLAARTESQAGSLEQAASAVVELSRNVKANAAHAAAASELADAARDTALKGGNAVGLVVETMEEIRGSASRITDIIGVIDGIAFQTNILALNASVEAARAGEHGRGFAVVAAEVRGLAQRSAEAAREIKELIGLSTDTVARGSAMVAAAGATMRDIVLAVRQVSEIMTDIARATDEQAAGIEDVSRTVHQMDAITQQNAALVEQASAAAESLRSQAAQLTAMLTSFKDRQPEPRGAAPLAVALLGPASR